MRIGDRRALLTKAVFLDLSGIESGSLESVIFKRISSLAEADVDCSGSLGLPPVRVPLGQKGFAVKQTPLSLLHPQDLIFKKYKRETKL